MAQFIRLAETFPRRPDDQIASDNWNRPYTRKAVAFPAKDLHDYKFWPHMGRVDHAFGDRNPVCSCVGMENYS